MPATVLFLHAFSHLIFSITLRLRYFFKITTVQVRNMPKVTKPVSENWNLSFDSKVHHSLSCFKI